jgi:hypothetical protein
MWSLAKLQMVAAELRDLIAILLTGVALGAVAVSL